MSIKPDFQALLINYYYYITVMINQVFLLETACKLLASFLNFLQIISHDHNLGPAILKAIKKISGNEWMNWSICLWDKTNHNVKISESPYKIQVKSVKNSDLVFQFRLDYQPLFKKETCAPQENSPTKRSGMLGLSHRGLNQGFLSHLGCSGQNTTIFCSQSNFLGAHQVIIKNALCF